MARKKDYQKKIVSLEIKKKEANEQRKKLDAKINLLDKQINEIKTQQKQEQANEIMKLLEQNNLTIEDVKAKIIHVDAAPEER